jgi:16S rRNA (cytosine1402-N4)-methyltransferase
MELHTPVLLPEVLDILESHISPGEDAFFLDATLGGGGHSEAVLEKFGNVKVVGFDRDASARDLAASRLSRFGGRARIVAANFGELEERAGRVMAESGGAFAGALFDFGVSNMQLTDPSRGFSFQEDGPLDMRMNTDGGVTAADILRDSDVRELSRIFRDYGEERFAFRIATAIVRAKSEGGLPDTTAGLTELIRRALPAPVQRKMGGHPARRVFQALRIAVNSELEAIPPGLKGALEITGNGGVIIVISYHSLEDRIVKRSFRSWSDEGKGTLVARRPITPSEEEESANRKSRSAKLRALTVIK